MWLSQLMFWTIGHLILALAAVGVAIEIEEGLMVLLNFVTYPLFVSGLMAITAFVGTYSEESASIPKL